MRMYIYLMKIYVCVRVCVCVCVVCVYVHHMVWDVCKYVYINMLKDISYSSVAWAQHC